jgi:hypothetical protein
VKYFRSATIILLAAVSGYLAGTLILSALTTLSNSDFHVYYYIPKTVLNLRRSMHPYTNFIPLYPYFFPPASLVLFKPLLYLPFHFAKFAFTILNLGLLALSIKYILKIFGVKNLLAGILMLISALLIYPVRFTVGNGQFNIILLFIFTYGLYAISGKGSKKAAGFLLGLGTITKISPFLMALYAGYKKNFSTLIFCTLTILIFSGAAELLVRPGINYYYARHVVAKVSSQAHENTWTDQSLLGTLKNYQIDDIDDRIGALNVEIDAEIIRSLISYAIVGFALLLFLYLDLKKEKSRLDLQISYLILVSIGVVGTGLTWFHQYTILLLPLWGITLISVKYLKKPYSLATTVLAFVVYLLWSFNLRDLLGSTEGILQKNMFVGAVALIAALFVLKIKTGWYEQSEWSLTLVQNKKVLLTAAAAGLITIIAAINPFELGNTLKEARDSARVKNIKYMGQALKKGSPNFRKGDSNSFIETENLDDGYVLFEKKEDNKVRADLSILLLDPLNNQDYNYQFSSIGGKDFTLRAKMESEKYINVYGEFYEFIYSPGPSKSQL